MRALFLTGLLPSTAQRRLWKSAATEARRRRIPVVIDVNARPRVWAGVDPGPALRVLGAADVVKCSAGDLTALGLGEPDRAVPRCAPPSAARRPSCSPTARAPRWPSAASAPWRRVVAGRASSTPPGRATRSRRRCCWRSPCRRRWSARARRSGPRRCERAHAREDSTRGAVEPCSDGVGTLAVRIGARAEDGHGHGHGHGSELL